MSAPFQAGQEVRVVNDRATPWYRGEVVHVSTCEMVKGFWYVTIRESKGDFQWVSTRFKELEPP